MAQSSYTKFPLAKNGQVADSRPDTVITPARAENAVIVGRAVTLGTDPAAPQVAILTGGAAAFGIVLAGDSQTDTFAANDEVNVLRRGSVFAICAGDFVAGNPVYALDATGAISSSATSATAVPNGRFLSSGSSGAVAKFEFDTVGQQ